MDDQESETHSKAEGSLILANLTISVFATNTTRLPPKIKQNKASFKHIQKSISDENFMAAHFSSSSGTLNYIQLQGLEQTA